MRLALGSPRVASAQVAQLLAPMAFMAGTAEAVPAPAVIELEVEAEAEKGKREKKR
jgi:hypothetical protein